MARSPALLRVATAGSVDDGKSTLVGRLLFDTNSLLADQVQAASTASRRLGLPDTDLALVVDGLRAEREQGITIDVAYRYFSTLRRAFVLADTPGHQQYTRNMVTGASTADAVLVLVDASMGLGAQSRRHLAVAALLRAPRIVLVVNKMDLVDYAEPVFREIVAEVVSLAQRLGARPPTPIPISALHGDNVTVESARMPWYGGPSLLAHLETLTVPEPAPCGFRMPVQYVLRTGGYRGYAGRVAAGQVRVGDHVTVLPSGTGTTVKAIHGPHGSMTVAAAGQSVALRLADQLDVARGDLLAIDPPQAVRTVTATVCWLADRPLLPGDRLLVRHGTRELAATAGTITGTLDVASSEYTPAAELGANDLGNVVLKLGEPLHPDLYRVSRGTGALLLLDPDSGATLGAGIVEHIDLHA
jgi:sulfate adenylyltransferase subunit 1